MCVDAGKRLLMVDAFGVVDVFLGVCERIFNAFISC